MLQKLTALRHNDFVRHNAIFFVGSICVAALNYLYYPIIGRLVSTNQFGEVQALVSVSIQAALLLSVLNNVAVNIVANSQDENECNKQVLEFGRLAVFMMVALSLLALPFIKHIDHFLHFKSSWPFVILSLSLIANAVVSPYQSFLRGRQAFGALSISSAITAGGRILGAAVLILVGFGVNGAIGGLIVAQLLTLGYSLWAARRRGLRSVTSGAAWWRLPDFNVVKPHLPYAALVLVVTLNTTVLFSVDTILAKHYFSPHVAGLYAGIATIGRIIFFLTGSVAAVILSSVKVDNDHRQNRATLVKSLLLVALTGGVTMLAFAALPRLFIGVLLGHRYLAFANLLPLLSLLLFLVSILNLVFSYDLALRRWTVAIIGVFGLVCTFVIVSLHHGTPSAMIQSLLLGTMITLGLRATDSARRWNR